MKANHRITLGLATLICLGLTSTLQADNQQVAQAATGTGSTYSDQNTHDQQTTERNARWRSTHMNGSADTTAPSQPTKFNKASDLIGMSVQNQDGQKLGDIKDIVINLDDSRVSYVVLSAGGVLGVGEKLLAVPLTAFTRSTDQNHLILNANKDSISRAESMGNNWPSVQNPTFGAMPFWQKPSVEHGLTNSPSSTIPAPKY